MMNALPPYRHESDTSRQAAETLTTAHKYREALLNILEERGSQGITIDEFAACLSVPPNAVSGRFSELAEASLICKTPMRRKTRSGKDAVVYLKGSWTDHAVPAQGPASRLDVYKTQLAIKGHGHVVPRNDGKKEGCGGPLRCRQCHIEKSYFEAMQQGGV